MMTIPDQVAKWILLDKIHPVAAWRYYYAVSQEDLAQVTQLSLEQIKKLEQSNDHLKDNLLVILARAFGVRLQALKFRYIPDTI